jgi:hypothetical protein
MIEAGNYGNGVFFCWTLPVEDVDVIADFS